MEENDNEEFGECLISSVSWLNMGLQHSEQEEVIIFQEIGTLGLGIFGHKG